MKVKNIKQYREVYKNEIRKMADRNENFIGNFYINSETNEREKGWFDLYFGDTDGSSSAQNGVENKLKSFLDMARDGQAIYEFLQNAVDAGGSKFLMFYKHDDLTNEDYLLVINNGEMFTPSSIRSILNIGSSTKSSDSGKIGQFGIGFKLAHRLVGKDNATNELINNLNGPILYSWKNNDINNFSSTIEVKNIDYSINNLEEKIQINDDNAWLFKILLTTFPCAYNEKPIIWDGKQAIDSPFSENELNVLINWLQEKNIKKHIQNDFEEGSLFLMKLGEGKLDELKDEPNLKEGVKFSLSVLKEISSNGNGLQTAVINDEEVHHPDLQFHKILITKNENDIDDYTFIRFGKNYNELNDNERNIINNESDIQILFGYKDFHKIGNYFKGSPSFYLFFPVSQEVHNFNYILHSNAFYKGSSRVFLQPGTNNVGLNERLFSKIIERIVIELKDLFISDIGKFKNLYLALLTSSKTQNNESFWITKTYTEPLDQSLKTIIPIKDDRNNVQLFNKYKSSNPVYFIDTNVDILLDYNYFILDKNELPLELKYKLTDKLEVKSYNIYTLLNEQDCYIKINQWLDNNEENINIFYKELTENSNQFVNNSLTDIQKDNLIQIKWIILSDKTIISIKDIKEKPIILLYKGLFESKDIFQKLNFLTSKNDLVDFINKFRNNFSQTELKQLTYNNLTKLFSNNLIDRNLDQLTNQEKFQIFETFRKLDENPGERIGLLKLYKNNIGIYQPFTNLINLNGGLLGLFSVDNQQFIGVDTTNFNRYLKVDSTALYDKIYYPQWKDLLQYLIINPNVIQVDTIINDITYAYKNSNFEEKDRLLLSDTNHIIFQKELLSTDSIIIPNEINIDNYQNYQENIKRYYKTFLPDEEYLKLFKKDLPFGYLQEINDPELFLENLSKNEIIEVLDIAKTFNIDFFEDNTIQKNGENYNTISTINQKQYYSDNDHVIYFFSEVYDNKFELLLTELEDYKELVKYKSNELNQFLISEENINKLTDQSLDNLLIIASIFDQSSRNRLLDRLPVIKLDFEYSHQNIENKLNFIYSIKNRELNFIQTKVSLVKDNIEILLCDIIPSTPTININNRNILFDKIFGEITYDNLALDFYNKFISDSVFDKIYFRELFNLNANLESTDLKNRFINSLDNQDEIKNIYQLYYLVFSGEFEINEIANFYILNAEDRLYKINHNWLHNGGLNIEFFNFSNLIHHNYNEDLELLNDIINNENFTIIKKFILDKNTDFNLLKNETNFSLIKKIQFLYEVYSHTPIDQRKIDQSQIDEFLSITPFEKIIAEGFERGNNFAQEVNDWTTNDNLKIEFLKEIEFIFEHSAIINLIRKIESNDVDFSNFSIRSFNNNDIELFVEYCSENIILFDLNNVVLKNVVIDIFKEYNKIKTDEKVLVYYNGNYFKFNEHDDLYKFDYSIIDQIFLNPDNDTLERVFDFYNVPISEIVDLIEIDNIVNILTYKIRKNEVKLLNEYYYNEWKKTSKNIDIFRGDKLFFDVYTSIDSENIKIGEFFKEDDFWLDQNGNQLTLFYTSNKSLKSLVEYFTTDKYDQYENYNLKIKLHELEEIFNSFNATISDVLINSDIEEIKEYLNTQIEKEERKVQRETITTEIKESEKYSKKWFIKYLEFLNTVTEKNSSGDIQYLRFSKIEKTQNPKFYKLSACSNVVPDNIDESTNVNIKIIAGNQRRSFSIINISQKNQTVLIQLNESLEDSIIDNFFVGEITYLPSIDLLSRLTNAFNKLNDWEDINEIFPAIEYIYGPPGTGKTTTLKERIFNLTQDNDNVKILVLTPTNKACDVLAEKLFNEGYEEFVRLSSPTSINIPEDLYTNDLSNELLNEKNVVISTIHRHSYYKISTEILEYFLYNSEIWDYIIIDEASMINLPYITFSALITKQCNPNCKLIIAGDPKQIPPVPELSDKEVEEIGVRTENIYSMFGLNSFNEVQQIDEVRTIDTVLNLDTQYRSLPDIGNLFSNFSYLNNVKTFRDNNSKRVLPVEVQNLLENTITFLNIPLEKDNPLFSINKLIYSSYHLYSGILIYEFIKYFDKHNITNEKWSIGIISPYKAQAILINRLLLDLNLSTNINIYADTVHGFQGDECDIVFFISNPSGYASQPDPRSLLANDFIYNVAISRARDYLIIVNPFEKLTQNIHINNLKRIHSEYINGNIRIKSSSEFEKIIFNKKDFIDENTFITNHDDVNVYKKGVYRYYVKKNSISIDFQITD